MTHPDPRSTRARDPVRRRFRGRALAVAIVAVSVARARAPAPAAGAPALVAPRVALAYPAAGTALPRDRAVVVFRIAPGDPADPVDAASLAVVAGGRDVGARFHLSFPPALGGAGEAWGPIADGVGRGALEPGAHVVAARICSQRGLCTTHEAVVLVAR